MIFIIRRSAPTEWLRVAARSLPDRVSPQGTAATAGLTRLFLNFVPFLANRAGFRAAEPQSAEVDVRGSSQFDENHVTDYLPPFDVGKAGDVYHAMPFQNLPELSHLCESF